jgi:ParB/RepB/Spo0J family partition protein
MATSVPASHSVSLDLIHVPANVRELDPEHVEVLARSIALQGILVLLVIRPSGNGFELVAGFHRIAAASRIGLTEVPVVVRDAETEDSDRAVENITRKQLNPYEEAKAVQAMLDRHLTEQGAAEVLGWSINRVVARVKILRLPERAQQMVGAGSIPLSAVDQLLSIGKVSPPVLDTVIAYLDEGNEWAAERLVSEPGWVLDAAMREGGVKTFAAYMDSVAARDVTELRLGKKAEEQLAEAEKLHKQISPYSYGAPPIRFNEQDID